MGKEYIVLFFSEKHREIISWFEYDGYKIRSAQVSEEECLCMQTSSVEIKSQYRDFFVFWNCGDERFRALTANGSPEFAPVLRKPHCKSTDILSKYSDIRQHKTVLIVPEARSIQPFPVWFWNVAAQVFRYMGFSVIFNAPEGQASIYKGKCILVPLEDMIGFVNECGHVFGVRTGFFDTISSCDAEMMILSTKAYKPIDKVFHIENSDERIRTFYYEDRDPFFMNTNPICFAQEHYRKINENVYSLIRNLCNSDVEQCCTKKVALITAYNLVGIFNKYLPQRDNTRITPFKEMTYSCEVINNRLVFKIFDIAVNRFRFDYKVYINGRLLFELDDLHNNFFSFPLSQSGEYHVNATITDLSTYNQEYFDTDSILYISPAPVSYDKLANCNDFHSYIVALEKFSQHITVYISSRDAHTPFKKGNNRCFLHVLKMLGLKTDFGSTFRYSYIGVINGGNVVDEQLSPDKKIQHEYEIDGNKITIESAGFNVEHSDKTPIRIEINGEDNAVNRRGLNIVVWNKSNNELLDSVCFDTFFDGQAYRK